MPPVFLFWRPDRSVEKSHELLNDGADDPVDRACVYRFRQLRQHWRCLMASDTILVVDDEADLVHGLRRTLAMEIDCRVLTAENGVQALDILSKTAVDVVLADVLTP
jgi:PleD family two-component response regulator